MLKKPEKRNPRGEKPKEGWEMGEEMEGRIRPTEKKDR
jgi:hypothetical protein